MCKHIFGSLKKRDICGNIWKYLEIFETTEEKSWKCLDRCGVGAASSSHSGALAVVGAGSGLLSICLKLKKLVGHLKTGIRPEAAWTTGVEPKQVVIWLWDGGQPPHWWVKDYGKVNRRCRENKHGRRRLWCAKVILGNSSEYVFSGKGKVFGSPDKILEYLGLLMWARPLSDPFQQSSRLG